MNDGDVIKAQFYTSKRPEWIHLRINGWIKAYQEPAFAFFSKNKGRIDESAFLGGTWNSVKRLFKWDRQMLE